jgi:hypothetical protein
MGALGWEIHRTDGLVVVSGIGLFDMSFIRGYRQAMAREGSGHYRKLFDLHQSDIALGPEDLQRISDGARQTALTAGPVAILMGKSPPPLLVDMAVLLQHRMDRSRRFRLFTDEAEARRWLASEPISAQDIRIPAQEISDSQTLARPDGAAGFPQPLPRLVKASE